MFTSIKKLFSSKEMPVMINKSWRQGMWVIYEESPHILYKLGAQATIHSVDKATGETTSELQVPFDSLRQAHYDEIPEVRRGISREQAKDLGYAT